MGKRYELGGFGVELDTPVEVGRGKGHLWFPSLHPVEGDDLLCLATTADDVPQGRWPSVLWLSRDAGASWQRVAGPFYYAHNSVHLNSRALLFMPYELWPLEAGERRNARAEGTVVECAQDGDVAVREETVRFLGFPRDLADYHEGELRLMTNGNIVRLRDGGLFTTLYGTYAREEMCSVFAVTSEDGGLTWHYLSQVARPEGEARMGEGPNESNTVRLKDERLLCVFRVGSALEFRKAYSPDEGVTWSEPRLTEGAWSVEPQLLRLANGLILLTGGRPGLMLWVCADGKGESWQPVNLARHHNALTGDEALHYSEQFCAARKQCDPPQSTSYTSLERIGEDEALICYDRLGNGWRGAPGPWGEHDVVFCVRVRARRTDAEGQA